MNSAMNHSNSLLYSQQPAQAALQPDTRVKHNIHSSISLQ